MYLRIKTYAIGVLTTTPVLIPSASFLQFIIHYFLQTAQFEFQSALSSRVSKKLKILLASPRGFCAGVDRAIEIVKKTLEKFGAPVYVRHVIVHNTQVVENLKKLGAVFVEELIEIKDRSRPVIFSAHGVPKSVPEEASNKNMFYVDAT